MTISSKMWQSHIWGTTTRNLHPRKT